MPQRAPGPLSDIELESLFDVFKGPAGTVSIEEFLTAVRSLQQPAIKVHRKL